MRDTFFGNHNYFSSITVEGSNDGNVTIKISVPEDYNGGRTAQKLWCSLSFKEAEDFSYYLLNVIEKEKRAVVSSVNFTDRTENSNNSTTDRITNVWSSTTKRTRFPFSKLYCYFKNKNSNVVENKKTNSANYRSKKSGNKKFNHVINSHNLKIAKKG